MVGTCLLQLRTRAAAICLFFFYLEASFLMKVAASSQMIERRDAGAIRKALEGNTP